MSGTIGSISVLFWASRIARGHHAEHSGHGDGVVTAMEALEVESTHVGGCENRARRGFYAGFGIETAAIRPMLH
jgi:hypothetical protein